MYLKHLVLFTNSMSLLLQDEISPEDLRKASELINNFCNLIPDLYGMEFCSFNVHILRHATECVQDWGPLWAYSLFQFENYNSVLVNSFSGTNKVGEQIVKRTIRSQEVYSQGESVFTNDYAKNFFGSLIDHKKVYAKSCESIN